MSADIKIALRIARAAKVAEFMFKQRTERIRWEEEELLPFLEDLRKQLGAGGSVPVYELEESDDVLGTS
jgi:hypothetical protein